MCGYMYGQLATMRGCNLVTFREEVLPKDKRRWSSNWRDCSGAWLGLGLDTQSKKEEEEGSLRAYKDVTYMQGYSHIPDSDTSEY